MRALVAGWFSFDEVIATVGDRAAADAVAGWLRGSEMPFDLAVAAHGEGGRRLRDVNASEYSHLVFVCGPLIDDPLLHGLLDDFAHTRRLAVDVSLVDSAVVDRFDQVWTRDGPGRAPRPDLAGLLSPPPDPLVVATVFADAQPEYGPDGRHDATRSTVERWLADRRLAHFEVATDLLTPAGTRRDAAQVIGALARSDVVVSSRLHGLVLGLLAGRPVIACDPVPGGAKVTAQARALDWPVVLDATEVTGEALDDALARCRALPSALPARLISHARGELATLARAVIDAMSG